VLGRHLYEVADAVIEAGASHRILETVRRIDQLGRGRALDADTPVGMLRVGGHLRELTILDRGDDAAPRYTHRTVGMNLLNGHGDTILVVVGVKTDGFLGGVSNVDIDGNNTL
jgi:hypothetical protein